MATVDNSPLDFDIQAVLTSTVAPVAYNYTGQFKNGANTFDIIRIVEIDDQHDYELNFACIKTAKVVVALGDYSTKIYPVRDQLEFVLKTEIVNATSLTGLDDEGSITSETFNVSIDPKARPFMSEDNNSESIPYDTQNLLDLVVLDIQLKNKLVDDVSKVSIGGQHLSATNADVVKNAVTLHCAQLDLDDDQKLLGVNMHHSAATDVNPQVVIPHGIMLSDLADYLQKKTGGIFSSGMAQYLHNRVWNVFPPYDTSGFDDAKQKFVVISVPAKRYPQVEKTYLNQNGIVTVLSTGNKRISSDKGQIQDNAGNGIMYTDANQIVSGFGTNSSNTTLVKRGQNNSEYVGEQAANGRNNVRTLPEGITSNAYLATSRMARSQGHFYTLEWENCDPALIQPGLNVKIRYMNQEDVYEVNGVLLKAHVHTKMNGKGLMADGYRSFAALVIFVKSDGTDTGGLVGLE